MKSKTTGTTFMDIWNYVNGFCRVREEDIKDEVEESMTHKQCATNDELWAKRQEMLSDVQSGKYGIISQKVLKLIVTSDDVTQILDGFLDIMIKEGTLGDT